MPPKGEQPVPGIISPKNPHEIGKPIPVKPIPPVPPIVVKIFPKPTDSVQPKQTPKSSKKKAKDLSKPIETKPISTEMASPQVMPPPISIPKKKPDTKSEKSSKPPKSDPHKSESEKSEDTDSSVNEPVPSPAVSQIKKGSHGSPFVWTNPAIEAKKEQKRARKEARRLKKLTKGSEVEKLAIDKEVFTKVPQQVQKPQPSPESSVPKKGEKPVVDETIPQCQESVMGEVDDPHDPCVIVLDDEDIEGPSTATLVEDEPQEVAEEDQAMSTSGTDIRPQEGDLSKTEKNDSAM
ncbi:MAG: hypothetical protein GY820_40355, partial [Gammaproteobacteria bacterium]|nr:hypothetical protein [Gammaproteobacteria bacterium]